MPEMESSITIMDYNKKQAPKLKSDNGNPTLGTNDPYYDLSFKIKDFDDPKEEKKYITFIKRAIRTSPEYHLWRKYILDVIGDNYCFITNEQHEDCTIEIHHHPFSLGKIVSGVVNKSLEKNIEFTSFDIVKEVVELHYLNKIGYVPLITSMHERFHRGNLSIPIDYVHGNWKALLDDYSWEDEDKELISKYISVINSNIEWKRNNYPGNKD